MLVLSRKLNQKILFPALDISVEVLKIDQRHVRLGIDAPRSVQVLRDELAQTSAANSAAFSANDIPVEVGQQFRNRLRNAATQLCRLHEQIETMQSENAETAILDIFSELRDLDNEVVKRSSLERKAFDEPTSRSVVLVEDNKNEAQLMASFLRYRDYDVQTLDNGASAIQYLASHETPCCVLLDMNMPQYDGSWTINEIRSNPNYEALKVFAVSGSSPAEYGFDSDLTGLTGWFQKPVNPEAIVMQIEQEHLQESVTVA